MNKVLLDYAQRIAILLDAGLVATANDLYTNMLKEFPLVKWEQLAFGDKVREFRTSCKVFLSITEDGENVYRLVFKGRHMGFFYSKESLDKKINELMY